MSFLARPGLCRSRTELSRLSSVDRDAGLEFARLLDWLSVHINATATHRRPGAGARVARIQLRHG
jgi:hypothetical protein